MDLLKAPSSFKKLPKHTKVLIVGGGIVGSGVYRDLSLHQVPCVLIDKKDFTSQTSQSSSKMLHGGIRYLENMDFGLVWEALHEKNLWLKLAPHLTYAEKFAMPVYDDGLRPLWMIRAGLFLYDALSSFQNLPHEVYTAEETTKIYPHIKRQGLTGSGVYSDAVVDDAKLTLECIYDGNKEKESHSSNHTSLKSSKKIGNHYLNTIKDEITGEETQIISDYIVFATGPFTDAFLPKLGLFEWKPKLKLSRGSHLWFKNTMLAAERPMVLTPKDGRVIFVIPQKDKTLVGTTEVPGNAEFDQRPSEDEVEYLFKNLQEYFPTADVGRDNLLGEFAGVRPLVLDDEQGNLGKTARSHKVYQPQENAFVILGGKYTTFRIMAQDVVNPLLNKMGIAYKKDFSAQALRQKSVVLPWQEIELNKDILQTIIENEGAKTVEDLLKRRVGLIPPFDQEALKLIQDHFLA